MSEPGRGARSGVLWHVVITVAGPGVDPREVRAGLERLCAERAFLLSCQYAVDRAELSYWEEADDLDDAAALALRLWGEHRASARLPAWHVVGLEVLDRDTFYWRAANERGVDLMPMGVRPF